MCRTVGWEETLGGSPKLPEADSKYTPCARESDAVVFADAHLSFQDSDKSALGGLGIQNGFERVADAEPDQTEGLIGACARPPKAVRNHVLQLGVPGRLAGKGSSGLMSQILGALMAAAPHVIRRATRGGLIWSRGLLITWSKGVDIGA